VKSYTSNDSEMLASFQERASRASGQPYRQWRLPNGHGCQVCLIRDNDGVLAICPEHHLVVEGSDFLETTFELNRRLIDKLGLPQHTRVTEMVVPPFTMIWGQQGTSSIKASHDHPNSSEESEAVAELAGQPKNAADPMNMDPIHEETDEPQIDLFSL